MLHDTSFLYLKAFSIDVEIVSFIHLLKNVRYTFAQDQDYFNRICKGRIKYLNECWNASGYIYDKAKPKIVHYTVYKPWLSVDMPNNNYFWNTAKKTSFYDYISGLKDENSKKVCRNLEGWQNKRLTA